MASLTIVSAIVSLAYNTFRIARDFISSINVFKRDRKTKKEYNRNKKNVKEGNVDDINKTIRGS